MDRKNIFITGFMGSGKTRIGKLLASELNKKFIDTDELIEQREHMSVKQIIEENGENWFREKEKEILDEIVNPENTYVVSLGGGVLIKEKNIERIKQSGVMIYIQSSIENLWKRTKNKTKRPLLLEDGKIPDKTEYFQNIQELLNQRMDGYKKADITINRDEMEAEQVVDLLLKKLQNIGEQKSNFSGFSNKELS